MTAIDREPGGSTMIRVSIEVRDMIEAEKIIPREPLNDCLKRIIAENRQFKQKGKESILNAPSDPNKTADGQGT
jgi:hypothetical protein